MPIPEPRPTQGAGLTYEETLVPGDGAMSFAELGRQCRLRAATGPAHVDPDLLPGARPRRPGWRASLGQADIAASHLRNQGVGAGDLFLFFGLFAPLGSRGLRRQEWFHSLFGYLQVDVVLDLHSDAPVPDWLCDHPHVSDEAQASFRPNLLYVARERLDFAPDRPGWGVFRYRPELRLTPVDATSRTVLELPRCFGPDTGTTVTYLPAHLWTDHDRDHVRVSFVGNKQEMVCAGNADVAAWAQEVIVGSDRWAP